MHTAALVTLVVGLASSQKYPDQLDILRGRDRTPQMKLLIDMSGSMNSGLATTPCDYYLVNVRGRQPDDSLSRIEQVVAALTGCKSPDDGIIDRWAAQMVMSAQTFHSPGGALQLDNIYPFPATGIHFRTDASDLEPHILALADRAEGGTPFVEGYKTATENFNNVFNDTNTVECRENAVVIMADGQGTSGAPQTFSWISGEPPLVAGNPQIPDAAAYVFGDLTDGPHDALQNVVGIQPIRTHTIGVNASDDANELLQLIAESGGGEALQGNNYDSLYTAFNNAMYQVNANADASFQGAAVQSAGLFTGNFVYQNLVQGAGRSGHWYGNVKKYCLFPETPEDNCFLEEGSTEGEWILNLEPSDIWSNSISYQTREGGVGRRIMSAMAGAVVDTPPSEIPGDPYANRDIRTWRLGQEGYELIREAGFTQPDSFSLNQYRHNSLVNHLYGYTFAAEPFDRRPTDFDAWPLGDTMNGGQLLLKYSENCEAAGDRCYFLSVNNTGMIISIDAVTGEEIRSIIPPYFWRPNDIGSNILADIIDQPTVDFSRRYYFDGGLALYHNDAGGDGVINEFDRVTQNRRFRDVPEEAVIVAGFGRGGAGYIKWDVSNLDEQNGVLDESTPPYPLVRDQTTGFKHLQHTWAAPWLGHYQIFVGGTNVNRKVAVFPSGHEPDLDTPTEPFALIRNRTTQPSYDSPEGNYLSLSCEDLEIPAELCRMPTAQEICTELAIPECSEGIGCVACGEGVDLAGCGGAPCYDWPGYIDYIEEDLSVLGINQSYPMEINIGPFSYSEGPSEGIAYRIVFSRIDIQPNDELHIMDGTGAIVQTIVGPQPGELTSEWIYAPEWSLRFEGNGINDVAAEGYAIDHIDVVRDVVEIAPEPILPALYIVDLDIWNGSNGAWAGLPSATDSTQAAGILARFTRDCGNTVIGASETCYDAASASTRDLQFMTCPISAPPAVFAEGGLLRAIYVGDECGQVWSFNQDRDRSTWEVRRLLSTNRTGAGGAVVGGGESRNYRKIFTRLDIVLSTCTGRRSVGVYFGTGNLQRPAAIPEGANAPADVLRNLQDPNITDFENVSSNADVTGVVWAANAPPGGYTLDELLNVTGIPEIDPTLAAAQAGFFIELAPEEKVLRSPLVFQGVANIQTYLPISAARECDDAVGRSYLYQFDNCTAAPVAIGAELAGDRKKLINEKSYIGGNLLVVTDQDQKPVTLSGDAVKGQLASVNSLIDAERTNRGSRLFLWRIDVD